MTFSHFLRVFSCFASRVPLPGGKTRRVQNPSVFIRFDAHVVKAGINFKGLRPLNNPGDSFDRLKTQRVKKSEKRGTRFSEKLSFKSDKTLSHHSIGNLLEARDVGAGNQVVAQTALSSGLRGGGMDVGHDVVQLARPLPRPSRSRRSEFWLISRPEAATPPALTALEGR